MKEKTRQQVLKLGGFTAKMNGTPVVIIPDYHTGGRCNGPLGWVRPIGTFDLTGTAIAVNGCDIAAREHSISWSNPEDLADHAYKGKPLSVEEWDRRLYAACCACD